jgi:serine/threonine protein kinase
MAESQNGDAPSPAIEEHPDDLLRLPSQSLVNQYRIAGDPLGSGGFAAVYPARSVLPGAPGDSLDRALKIMLPRELLDVALRKHYDETRQRFYREYEVSQLVQHRGIIKVYGLEEILTFNRPTPVDLYASFTPGPRPVQPTPPNIAGLPMLVQERLRGETLGKRIERGCMPWREAVQLVHDVCGALSYAHSHEVVHRDIKPENIYLLDDRPAYRGLEADWCYFRLLDFGIAKPKRAPKLTAVGLTLGTPNYFSREQVRGEEVDQRTDVYALGVVLYYTIFGRYPIDFPQDENPAAFINAILAGEYRDCRQWGIEVPDQLDVILRKATELYAVDRYQSAPDFRDALADMLNAPITRLEHEKTKRAPAAAQLLAMTNAETQSTGDAAPAAKEPEEGAPVTPAPPMPSEKPRPRTLLMEQGAALAVVEREESAPTPIEPEESRPRAVEPPARRRGALAALAVAAIAGGAIVAWRAVGAHRAGPSSSPPAPMVAAPISPPPAAPALAPPSSPAPAAAAPNSPPGGIELLNHNSQPAPQPPAPRPPAAPPAAPAPAPSRGYIAVWAYPWATVSLDGKEQGPTPQRKITTRPGSHVVELVAQDGQKRTRRVNVEPGKTATVRVNFTKPEEGSR